MIYKCVIQHFLLPYFLPFSHKTDANLRLGLLTVFKQRQHSFWAILIFKIFCGRAVGGGAKAVCTLKPGLDTTTLPLWPVWTIELSFIVNICKKGFYSGDILRRCVLNERYSSLWTEKKNLKFNWAQGRSAATGNVLSHKGTKVHWHRPWNYCTDVGTCLQGRHMYCSSKAR